MPRGSFSIAFLATLLSASAVHHAHAAETVEVPEGARDILSEKSPVRWHMTWRKPIVPVEALKAAGEQASEPAVLDIKMPYSSRVDMETLETPPPPAEWKNADFDDSIWNRAYGPVFSQFLHFQNGLLCFRTKFVVTDPAQVEGLFLDLGYRGGVVVHLNGKEVARNHMPAGEIAPNTPAVPYGEESWLDSKGQPIPSSYHGGQRIRAGETDLRDRFDSRSRHLGPIRIPADALKKGVNVLTIENHRSDYHPVALKWFGGRLYDSNWIPLGIESFSLKATGGGIEPNVARPEQPQVWNIDVHDEPDFASFGDPSETLRPVRIVAAKNGAFHGAVIVSHSRKLAGVKATASELTQANGNGKIAAASVDVRYAVPGDKSRFDVSRPQLVLEALMDRPPAEATASGDSGGAVLPIVVRVRVPKDAAAGNYAGKLSITGTDLDPITVELAVEVADWALPDPADFRTFAGVYQSPDTLAKKYEVEPWSDAHWKLIEKSLELCGRLGTKLVNIPLSEHTQFGNDESMVVWIRKADGSFDYDYSRFDRYMDLVVKHMGKVPYVSFHVWHAGGWSARPIDQENTVTVRDEKTGKHESVQVPVFATPESKAFWSPVLRALKERLEKREMGDSMCLGILSDSTGPPEMFAMFQEIIPGIPWTRGCHVQTFEREPGNINGGGKVVVQEFVYGNTIQAPEKMLPPPIWNMNGPGVSFFRGDFDTVERLNFRSQPERGLFCRTAGFGRVCLDFWKLPVQVGDRTESANLFNKYPFSSCAQRQPTIYALAQPGPDGPVPSMRFEMMREGVQEAEAVMFLAEALDSKSERLGPELTEEVREVYLERIDTARRYNGSRGMLVEHDHFGWQDRSQRLYETAAKVAAKLGE
ncbi:MAG: glycoside hydrolase domain-containing protein [Planctomycetaceae bacterium]